MREQNERASLAWHTAMLVRAEKLPKLKQLLEEPGLRKPRRPQTMEEQIAIARLWTDAVNENSQPKG